MKSYLILGYISPYRPSGLNGLCSDNNNETVEDKHECRIAFADMVDYLQSIFQAAPRNILHKIDVPFTSNSHPSGCIIQKSGSTFTVRWNDISNGNRDSSTHQICKNGIISWNSNMKRYILKKLYMYT